MVVSINDHGSLYEQARTAYMDGNYEVAADLIDRVVQNFTDDPNSHLLRGHIHYVLENYDIARDEYRNVLELTDDSEITHLAHSGLDNIEQYLLSLDEFKAESDPFAAISPTELSHALITEDLNLLPPTAMISDLDPTSFDVKSLNEDQPSLEVLDDFSLQDPFEISSRIEESNNIPETMAAFSDNPFAPEFQLSNKQPGISNGLTTPTSLDLSHFSLAEDNEGNTVAHIQNFIEDDNLASEPSVNGKNKLDYSPVTEASLPMENPLLAENTIPVINAPGEFNPLLDEQNGNQDLAQEVDSINQIQQIQQQSSPDSSAKDLENNTYSNSYQAKVVENSLPAASLAKELPLSPLNKSFVSQSQSHQVNNNRAISSFDDDGFDLEAFESAFGSESFAADEEINSSHIQVEAPKNEVTQNSLEFLNEFDEFDALGDIPEFAIEDGASFSNMPLLAVEQSENREISLNKFNDHTLVHDDDREEELFTMTGSQGTVPSFTQPSVAKVEPLINADQSPFPFYENASLDKKQWFIAGVVGIASLIVVASVSALSTYNAPVQQRKLLQNTGWVMALAAGIAGGVAAGFMGNLTLREIRRTTKDLQNQFDAIRQGNLNVQATVYSKDELGYLAGSFNDMSRVIFTITNEAQRKARDQEEDKETLQRQVIRLLDDVEGAARGDLTVQAEVTADVLGAVADAFNLTIQNLRDIVQQVKYAAQQVTKGSTNSETFARALSSDALHQAQELADTLNSVQVMTESIQRVAEAAREAESVARDANTIALKGGEAVENTVAGILEIRETVAETTRKVKRLAESSQEIAKIVALISQIASRTNLLALNASIEAARAGEGGRGFAIVADEVRQLADKSAKSLKEIEQIVMQIQSETNSVMSAMEEGTQQVIKGTKLAEEAKRSLENIIQVANRIDSLVRSISNDTVEQTETSRAVAQVMQSVELTAQETSQEAQRVSGALQQLVGVSRDLISSVERFRVETMESK